MDEKLLAEAARKFSYAADAMVDAIRKLEQCGISDEPAEELLLALERMTMEVHRLYAPEARVHFEIADLANPMACRLAGSALRLH